MSELFCYYSCDFTGLAMHEGRGNQEANADIESCLVGLKGLDIHGCDVFGL